MTILDPNYILHVQEEACKSFAKVFEDIKERDVKHAQSLRYSKQLNRRFLLQKIFYKVRSK